MAPSTTPSSGKPAPGDRARVTMERIGAQAMAIASLHGFTLLVPRGLVGEEAEVELEAVHPRYAVARQVELLRPAPERVSPPCAHFGVCGGCDWLHVDYTCQLDFKRQVLEDQLTRIGKITPPADWRITPAESTLEYRDKLDFAIARENTHKEAQAEPGTEEPAGNLATAAPGFHGCGGGAPVPIERCHLAPAAFSKLAGEAVAALAHGTASGAGGLALAGLTRLTVQSTGEQRQSAEGEGQSAGEQGQSTEGEEQGAAASGLALTLHFNNPRAARQLKADARPFIAQLEAAVPELRTVALSVKEWKGRQRRTALHVLKGAPAAAKPVGGHTYQAPLNGFFQVNLPQAEKLVARVTELLAGECAQALEDGPPPSAASRPPASVSTRPPPSASTRPPPLAMDLFCGVGLYALPLARRGFRVAGMELSREAVRAAMDNAAQWGLEGCAFQAGDLARPGALREFVARHGAPAAMVLNPPRAGLPAPLSQSLLDLGPPLLVYVSCDGATFARDAARLAPRYELASLEGFDLFPQTHHLEVLGVFRLLPAPRASTPASADPP